MATRSASFMAVIVAVTASPELRWAGREVMPGPSAEARGHRGRAIDVSRFVGIPAGARPRYTKGMADTRQTLGRSAEDAAAAWLQRSGLSVIARNVRFPEGEIDLVCREGRVWVFVEVKCRHAR